MGEECRACGRRRARVGRNLKPIDNKVVCAFRLSDCERAPERVAKQYGDCEVARGPRLFEPEGYLDILADQTDLDGGASPLGSGLRAELRLDVLVIVSPRWAALRRALGQIV